jgi:hypothetical protein
MDSLNAYSPTRAHSTTRDQEHQYAASCKVKKLQ